MSEIFVHKGKSGNSYYRYDTPSDIEFAWQEHFRLNDGEGHYADLDEKDAILAERARLGDWEAAYKICAPRHSYEYEEYSIEPLIWRD